MARALSISHHPLYAELALNAILFHPKISDDPTWSEGDQ